MKRYMLDTDTCSYIIKERPASVLKRFKRLAMEQICVSAVTYAELLYGVERSSSKRINQAIVDDFVRHPKAGINSYGASNPAEFFAVLSEVFFECPRVLKDTYPDIFKVMVTFFGQNPLGL